MKIKIAALSCLLITALTGCVPHTPPSAQELTGHIGCPPDEITISNFDGESSQTTDSYLATCRNTKYYCSTTYKTGGKSVHTEISCSKADPK